MRTIGLAAAILGFAASSVQAAALKAVAFDLEVVADSPMDRGSPAQTARAKKASDAMRQLLAKSGQVALVDPAPQAAEIEKNLPLRSCNGCDLDIAQKLGADIEITTALQRSSNVILGFSGSVRDVRTGKVLRSALVDVRGDTDEMWAHGVKFLVKDRLLDPPLPDGPDALRTAVDKMPGASR